MIPGRARAATATGSAAVAALVVALLTPGTHGAFSAAVDGTARAALNPFLTCAAAVAAERERGTLVFAYPLDDPAGSAQAADAGSTGPARYSGTMATTGRRAMPCRRDGGTAWAPDGSTGDLLVDPVVLRSRFTFEVRFRTVQADAVIASVEPTQAAGNFALAVSHGGVALVGPGGPLAGGGSGAGDGGWHHLALVIDGSDGIRLYLDSEQVAYTPFDMPDGFPVRWRLAADDSGALGIPRLQGAMRYAELTSRALTAQEVRAHDVAGRTPVLRGAGTERTASSGTLAPAPETTLEPSPEPSASTQPSASEQPPSAAAAEPVQSPSAAPVETAQPAQPVQEGTTDQPAGDPDVLVDQGG